MAEKRRRRPYVGTEKKSGDRKVFLMDPKAPDKEQLLQPWKDVVGPFKTRKAAIILKNNPSITTVKAAENMAELGRDVSSEPGPKYVDQ